MNEKKIVEERIEILFSEAAKAVAKRPELAKRYVHLACRLAMRHNISLSREQRSHFCRSCRNYLKFGANATVRIARKGGTHRLIICRTCGKEKRLMIGK